MAGRLVETHAEHVLDDHLMAEPDAQRDPPVGGGLRSERLLGHRHRVARERRDDGGTERDLGNLPPHDPEQRQRLETEDLWNPPRREAVIVGLLRRSDESVDGSTRRGGRFEDTDLHRPQPMPFCPAFLQGILKKRGTERALRWRTGMRGAQPPIGNGRAAPVASTTNSPPTKLDTNVRPSGSDTMLSPKSAGITDDRVATPVAGSMS